MTPEKKSRPVRLLLDYRQTTDLTAVLSVGAGSMSQFRSGIRLRTLNYEHRTVHGPSPIMA
jgi:hypothetical protein